MEDENQYQQFSMRLTLLLNEMAGGDKDALDRAYKILEGFLRSIVEPQLSSADKVLMQATAFIDDLWMHVFGSNKEWESRDHFYASATEIIRHLIIDEVRRRNAGKRSANFVDLDKFDPENGELTAEELVSLDEALRKLETSHPRLAEVIQHRFYFGRTTKQIGSC